MLLELYLMKIQEFRAENLVDFCKSIDCPRKRLKCLLRLRMDGFCKYDIPCQRAVDREIEFLYNEFEPQGGKLVKPLISGEEFPALPDWMPDERPSALDNSNARRFRENKEKK